MKKILIACLMLCAIACSNLSAATILVPPGGNIQTAVDAAVNGDTVELSAGTYIQEVLIVNKSINLIGQGKDVSIIQAPSSATHLSNSFTFNGINFWCIVTIDNQTVGLPQTVNISELTVNGSDQQDTAIQPIYGNSDRFYGIGYHEASGQVQTVHVTSVRQYVDFNEITGGGIVFAANTTNSAVINNCLVDQYQRIAIDCRGTGLTAFVENNTVNRGYTIDSSFIPATPNGIQLLDSLGYVIFNTVEGNIGTAMLSGASGSGIILFGTSNGCLVAGNQTDNNDNSIITVSSGTTKINNNTIQYTDTGTPINPGYGLSVEGPVGLHELYSNVVTNTPSGTNVEIDTIGTGANQTIKMMNNQINGAQIGMLVQGETTTGPVITMNNDSFTGTSGYYIQEITAPNDIWPSSSSVAYDGLVSGHITMTQYNFLLTKILDKNTDPSLGLVISYITPPPPTIPPTVTAVSPNTGTLSGGNSVTITGTGFTSSNTTASFGTTPALITVNSDTSITATAPPGTGTVNVTVTTPTGTSATTPADQYIYAAGINLPPQITNLDLNYGEFQGANTVTITGTGFLSGGTSVLFGTTPATNVTVLSNTTLTAVAPAGTGLVNVTATTVYGTSATSLDSLYIYALLPPSVSSISPTSGPEAGGTLVTIRGAGFTSANTTVAFGGVAATNVTVISDTEITAVSPSGIGVVDVTVTTPLGTSRTVAADLFTYIATPVGPLPPTNFKGCVTENKFVNVFVNMLEASWTASPSANVVSYRIYEGTELLGTVPATGPLTFFGSVRSYHGASSVTIVAVDSAGVQSTPATITLHHCHHHHHHHRKSH